jgi:hypothetical protein
MRASVPLLAVAALALAACEPPVPDSVVVRGPGFDSPQRIAERDAALRGPMPTPSQTIQPPGTPPGSVPTEGNAVEAPMTEAEAIAARTRDALGAPPAGVVTTPSGATAIDPLDAIDNPAPMPAPGDASSVIQLDRDNPGISREQDFDTVASRRSIEADAARVNAARAQRQVIAPTTLERPPETGPNIITYALEQARPVGAAGAYRRPITASQRAAERRCQNYRDGDAAQEAFLAGGGPQRDRFGLDPDGDGNACGWDPAAYRSLVRN